MSSFGVEIETSSFEEACKDPRWVDAIQAEIKALECNNTRNVVCLPYGKTVIGCRWIFKIKYKADGQIERFKAILVT